MFRRFLSVLFVSMLLFIHIVSGVGFSRHTCCKGQTHIALLLEQTEDCHHGAESSCCRTEVFQFLPQCLAERGVHLPAWDNLLSFGSFVCPPVLILSEFRFASLLPFDFSLHDWLVDMSDRAFLQHRQWRL